MSKRKEELIRQEQIQQEIARVRLPKPNQVFGIVDQRLGASRMRVKCLDGKTRICRIPGRLKRRLWVREGDLLLVEKWAFEGDKKGDVIFKYTLSQIDWLKRKGLLKELEQFEEF